MLLCFEVFGPINQFSPSKLLALLLVSKNIYVKLDRKMDEIVVLVSCMLLVVLGKSSL